MAYAGGSIRRQRDTPVRTHTVKSRKRGTPAPDCTSGKATEAVPDPSLVAMLDRLREVATAHDHDDDNQA